MWIGTSEQTPDQTVDEILSRAPEEAWAEELGT
jgi:hypothetical protein